MEAFAIILLIFSFILAPHRVAAKLARVPVALLIALIHVMFRDRNKRPARRTTREKKEAPYVAYISASGVVTEFFIPRLIINFYKRIKDLICGRQKAPADKAAT